MKMKQKIGLQLYSVRKELSLGFDNTLQAISKLGFEYLELAGLHFLNPKEFALKLQQNKLQPISMHCDVLTTVGLNRSMHESNMLNCNNLVCPWVQPNTFKTEQSIIEFAAALNVANQKINAQGKTLLYHNHDFEFQKIGDVLAYDVFVAKLHPTIQLQFDVYNCAIARVDPIQIFNKHADRITMLHLKDGNISPAKPNKAVGFGKMDYKNLLNSFSKLPEWSFIEFETCNSNIFGAIKKSMYLFE